MYNLEDLVLFTVDGWFGLYETINTQYWPLQLAGLAWVLLSFFALTKGIQKLLPVSIIGLVSLWLACAYVFFFGEYKQLSWVGTYYGWGFSAQALILLLLFLIFRPLFSIQHLNQNIFLSPLPAYCVLISGFLLIPLMGLVEGRNWASLDIIGTGPDSLALITMGFLLLIIKQKNLQILLCIIPTAWLIVSATNAWPMGLIQGISGLTTWALFLTCLVIYIFIRKIN